MHESTRIRACAREQSETRNRYKFRYFPELKLSFVSFDFPLDSGSFTL